MQTYHLKKATDNDGKMIISGLPPSEEFTILLLHSESPEWQERMKQWMNDLREHHPFAEMNKDEILRQLEKTREEVWKTEYGR
ncbi:MAG: hypothetical protein GY749_18130 [Desulfobacteraceae bacterium]|nr:hypothetical protein [Desulfobacteraceae bacterium]MCP4346894.1 hypothetical protein [Desulfobacterales bacterium]